MIRALIPARLPAGTTPFVAGMMTASLALTTMPSLRLPLVTELVRAAAAERGPLKPAIATPPGDEDLLEIVEVPHPERDLSGMPAEERNRTLAFTQAAVQPASPFAAGDLQSASGKTAMQCLTQAVYYEAAREPVDGRRAVAQVILNRMRHPAFPKSVCGVVYQGSTRPGCQFSFTCDGSLLRRPDPGLWQQAARIAYDALNGYVEKAVGYATHYHANYVFPYWAPRLTKLTRIGAHIFYRWPGTWGKPASFGGQYAGNEVIPPWRKVYGNTTRLAGIPADLSAGIAGAANSVDAAPRIAELETAGKLDTSTGWRMHISDPAELNRATSAALRRQTGTNLLSEQTQQGATHDAL